MRKPRLVNWVICLLLAGTLLSACQGTGAPGKNRITLLPPAVTAQSPTLVFTTTATYSPTPTKTIPTFTATSTITPTFENTLTWVPTLTGQQTSDLIIDLIKTNRGCQFPCWWGIEPGETLYDQAMQLFLSWGISWRQALHGVGAPLFGNYEGISFNSYLYENSNVVNLIYVGSEGFVNPQYFTDLWSGYSPEKIIKIYGQPTRIWLKPLKNICENGSCSGNTYDLDLFYDNKGILLSYSGVIKVEKTNQICPSFSSRGNLSAHIGIWLQSTTSGTLLEDTTGERLGPREYLHPIFDVAGISVEEFYDRLNQEQASFCFEVPEDQWQ